MRPLLHRILVIIALVGQCACGEGEAWMYDSAQLPLNVQAVSPNDAYRQTVHALVTQRGCGGCHTSGGLGSGAYADANVETAFDAAVKMPLFNTRVPEESKILKKLKQAALHNCGTRQACDQLIGELSAAIADFAQRAPENPFAPNRIESSQVLIQTLLQNPTKDSVRFELPSLSEGGCAPTLELKWTSSQSGSTRLFSIREPTMRLNCAKNVRLKSVQVLLNGGLVATTLQGVNTLVIGPIDSRKLLDDNHASGTFTAQEGDRLSLGFETLNYAQ